MLRELYNEEPRVKVDFYDGLLVEYTRKNGIKAVIRGLRPTGDFEREYRMASMNHQLNPEVDTIFLMTDGSLNYISSSLVKEIFTYGGDISQFVPHKIAERMTDKSKRS